MNDNVLYKLVILYMLDLVKGPLSTDQLSEFLLQKKYTNYFEFQEMLDDLVTSGLITEQSTYNRTLYHLTDNGRSTLAFYGERIPDDIRKDVLSYLYDNELEIREILSVFSDYYPDSDGNYCAHCQIREHQHAIVDLKLSVSVRRQAEAICTQWKEHYSEVYEMLMDTLLK